MDPAPSPGNHGNHQYAGRMAFEGYNDAGDPSVFPSQLSDEGLDRRGVRRSCCWVRHGVRRSPVRPVRPPSPPPATARTSTASGAGGSRSATARPGRRSSVSRSVSTPRRAGRSSLTSRPTRTSSAATSSPRSTRACRSSVGTSRRTPPARWSRSAEQPSTRRVTSRSAPGSSRRRTVRGDPRRYDHDDGHRHGAWSQADRCRGDAVAALGLDGDRRRRDRSAEGRGTARPGRSRCWHLPMPRRTSGSSPRSS